MSEGIDLALSLARELSNIMPTGRFSHQCAQIQEKISLLIKFFDILHRDSILVEQTLQILGAVFLAIASARKAINMLIEAGNSSTDNEEHSENWATMLVNQVSTKIDLFLSHLGAIGKMEGPVLNKLCACVDGKQGNLITTSAGAKEMNSFAPSATSALAKVGGVMMEQIQQKEDMTSSYFIGNHSRQNYILLCEGDAVNAEEINGPAASVPNTAAADASRKRAENATSSEFIHNSYQRGVEAGAVNAEEINGPSASVPNTAAADANRKKMENATSSEFIHNSYQRVVQAGAVNAEEINGPAASLPNTAAADASRTRAENATGSEFIHNSYQRVVQAGAVNAEEINGPAASLPNTAAADASRTRAENATGSEFIHNSYQRGVEKVPEIVTDPSWHSAPVSSDATKVGGSRAAESVYTAHVVDPDRAASQHEEDHQHDLEAFLRAADLSIGDKRLMAARRALEQFGNDVIPRLLDLLSNGPVQLHTLAIAVLRGAAAISAVIRQEMVNAGAIPILLPSLSAGDYLLQEHGAATIGSLAIDDAFKKPIMTAGAIPPLVQLLKTGTETAKELTARALRNLAFHDEDIQKAVVAAGAIPPLVQLLKEGTESVQRTAKEVLGNLAWKADSISSVAAAGTIPLVVQLLWEGSGEAKESAAETLWDLSMDAENKFIAAAGAIPPLVQLLREGTEGAKEAAAGILRNLAWNNPESRMSIAAAGAIPPLIQLLREGTEGAKEGSARALGNLSLDAALAVHIYDAGAVPPLLQLVGSGNDSSKRQALWALRSLAFQYPPAKRAIGSKDTMSLIKDLLESGSDLVSKEARKLLNLFS